MNTNSNPFTPATPEPVRRIGQPAPSPVEYYRPTPAENAPDNGTVIPYLGADNPALWNQLRGMTYNPKS